MSDVDDDDEEESDVELLLEPSEEELLEASRSFSRARRRVP